MLARTVRNIINVIAAVDIRPIVNGAGRADMKDKARQSQ